MAMGGYSYMDVIFGTILAFLIQKPLPSKIWKRFLSTTRAYSKWLVSFSAYCRIVWINIYFWRQLFSRAMKSFFRNVKKYDPYCVKIIKGEADALKVSFEEMFFYRCFTELERHYLNRVPLCTSFAATGKATEGGITIFGQNIDFWPVDLQF